MGLRLTAVTSIFGSAIISPFRGGERSERRWPRTTEAAPQVGHATGLNLPHSHSKSHLHDVKKTPNSVEKVRLQQDATPASHHSRKATEVPQREGIVSGYLAGYVTRACSGRLRQHGGRGGLHVLEGAVRGPFVLLKAFFRLVSLSGVCFLS